MEHELRLATYGHRAGGQDDVSLNKLPQITSCATQEKGSIPTAWIGISADLFLEAALAKIHLLRYWEYL